MSGPGRDAPDTPAGPGRWSRLSSTTWATGPREHPDRPAVIMSGSGEVTTYRMLDERSNRLAHALREAGLRTGDHLAVMMENSSALLEVTWAAQRAGLYYTALNSHLRPRRGAAHPGRLRGRGLLRVGPARGDRRPAGRSTGSGSEWRWAGRSRASSPTNGCWTEGPPSRSPTRPRVARCSTRRAPPGCPKGVRKALIPGPPGDSGVGPRADRHVHRGPRHRGRHRLPVAGPALPFGPAGLLHGRPPAGWHLRGHGVLRCRTVPRCHRALPGHPRPVRAHHVHPHAAPARGGAAGLRPVQPGVGGPRRRPLPRPGQAADAGVVGSDHPRVLRRHRGHRVLPDHPGGVAGPPGLGGATVGRGAHRRARRRGGAGGPDGHGVLRRRAPVRVPQRPREDGRDAQRPGVADPGRRRAPRRRTGTCT